MGSARDELGSSMIAVVMVSMVVSLLTMIALASSVGALRASRSQRGTQVALDLAEAGVSRALSLLASDPGYTNHGGFATDPSAREVIDATLALPIERSAGGELTWLVPDGADVAYGVGFVPSRARPAAARVVRVEYEVVLTHVSRAVLAEGSLHLAGTARVSGADAHVHANGDLSLEGSVSIAGDASASGTVTTTGGATVGGAVISGAPRSVVSRVDPASYRQGLDYDLCPDLTVRRIQGTVCTGAIAGSGVLGWNGWVFDASTGWQMRASSTIAGGFYVHLSSVRITGSSGSSSSPWVATIVVGGLEAAGLLTSGDLVITGNVVMKPYTSGILGVAHRDVAVSGYGADLEGLLIAGEQLSMTAGGLTGQLVTAGASDTPGSPVSASVISDASIRSSLGGPPASGGVSVVRWAEL